jgi:hypothetical protein
MAEGITVDAFGASLSTDQIADLLLEKVDEVNLITLNKAL